MKSNEVLFFSASRPRGFESGSCLRYFRFCRVQITDLESSILISHSFLLLATQAWHYSVLKSSNPLSPTPTSIKAINTTLRLHSYPEFSGTPSLHAFSPTHDVRSIQAQIRAAASGAVEGTVSHAHGTVGHRNSPGSSMILHLSRVNQRWRKAHADCCVFKALST
jgi:hypothetical protein